MPSGLEKWVPGTPTLNALKLVTMPWDLANAAEGIPEASTDILGPTSGTQGVCYARSSLLSSLGVKEDQAGGWRGPRQSPRVRTPCTESPCQRR